MTREFIEKGQWLKCQVGGFRGSLNSQKRGLDKRERKAKELLTGEEGMWKKPGRGRSGEEAPGS